MYPILPTEQNGEKERKGENIDAHKERERDRERKRDTQIPIQQSNNPTHAYSKPWSPPKNFKGISMVCVFRDYGTRHWAGMEWIRLNMDNIQHEPTMDKCDRKKDATKATA